MSEAGKKSRADNRAKARRLVGGGDPHRKVDSSSWMPTEPLNTTAKTGARPVRPRIYKAGGKVQGDRGPRRADKKARGLAGDISAARTRRNVVSELGTAHEGAFRKGGRARRDMGGMIDPREQAQGALAAAANRSGTPTNRLPSVAGRTPMSSMMGLKKGGKAGHDDKAQDMAMIKGMVKKEALKRKDGGKAGTYFGGTRPTGGRAHRKAGGRAKGKTNINIHINPSAGQQAQMPPQGPVKPPMPVPVPPPQAAPMPMPMGGANMPPPSMVGAPPPQMPRKRGGRTNQLQHAGAGGGLGRLEKIKIQEHSHR